MPGISVSQLFNFSHMKVTFSEAAEFKSMNIAGVVLMPDKRYKPVCPKCLNKCSKIHLTRSRIVRDLPLGSFRKPRICYSYQLVNCLICNAIHTELPSVADIGGPRVTFRFARYIQDLCKLMTIKEVADHLQLDWKTVKKIDKQGLEEEFKEIDYTGLRILAVDEIAYGKYQKYLTIVIDYETGRVVWTGKERKRQTLQRFFDEMPTETRESIEAVAMDMWEPFAQAVKHSCPQAVIVYDLFHIVAKYSEVITSVRRTEYQKASEDDARVIRGSRWMLLKNPENLTEDEKPRLDELLATNESLATVYILKDSLKAIWQHTDELSMKTDLDNWCDLALEAKLPQLNRFVKMLKRHEEGILNHAKYAIHTSKLEGINNKIKVLKREAYGFHDLQYLGLKIKQQCPGKPVSIN